MRARLSAGDEANSGRHTVRDRQDARLRGASALPWPGLEERENQKARLPRQAVTEGWDLSGVLEG